jgi:hypothetical protein
LGNRKWGQCIGKGEYEYDLPYLKDVNIVLNQLKKQILDNNKRTHSYDQQIAVVNIMLCQLMLEPKKASQQMFDDLLLAYRKIWARVGSTAKKFAETEQLEIIISALSFSKNREVVKLNKGILSLKEALDKMLANG